MRTLFPDTTGLVAMKRLSASPALRPRHPPPLSGLNEGGPEPSCEKHSLRVQHSS